MKDGTLLFQISQGSSELSQVLALILHGSQPALGDDTVAGVILILVVLVALPVEAGGPVARHVSCPLSSAHSRLHPCIKLLLGLNEDVESVFDLSGVAAEARVDEMLSNLGTKVAQANLVEPEQDQDSDVERLILLVDHNCERHRIVEHDSSSVGGGLKLQELRRSDDAGDQSTQRANHGGSRGDEQERHSNRLPVVQRMEHMRTKNGCHDSIKCDEY